ncbi:FHIPEP family type III secretion protein [Serratia symbiotica]|nr:FHIPEP family type III secretion protein [Serratia symbiotica]
MECLGLNLINFSDEKGAVTTWVKESNAEEVKQLGILVLDDMIEIIDCVETLLLRHINEFFGIQETKNLLDDLEKKYPELLREFYHYVTVQKITEVFQSLLVENISIRNMKLILETLVQWVPKEKDSMILVEYVRVAMARYISSCFAVDGRLNVLMINAQYEDMIRQSIRQAAGGIIYI